jgi:hypothetical protein
MDDLAQFITSIRTDLRIRDFDEASTKQQIVGKILHLLGWDTWNAREVWPEYGVATRRVDYCLKIGTESAVFIEVKQTGTDLEAHQKQLLDYSFEEGVDLAVLTNGLTWWLYLPMRKGSKWEQRRFFAVDIALQEPQVVASRFIEFLSKASVASGVAAQAASSMYEGNRKALALQNALPEAWNKLVGEPDAILVDRLCQIAESLCGFRAEPADITSFLASRRSSLILHPATAPFRHHALPARQPDDPPPTAPAPGPILHGGYTGKKPQAFIFKGARHEVQTWREVLLGLCTALYAEHSSSFESTVLPLRGKYRQYFSRDPKEVAAAIRIANTSVFAMTNLNAEGIVKRCEELVQAFGHPASDFRVETD